MLRNPATGRIIKHGGATHKQLLRAQQYGGLNLFGKKDDKKKLPKSTFTADEIRELIKISEKGRQDIIIVHSALLNSALDDSKAYKLVDKAVFALQDAQTELHKYLN